MLKPLKERLEGLGKLIPTAQEALQRIKDLENELIDLREEMANQNIERDLSD